MGILDLLRLPEASKISDLDAPEVTLLHRRIIQKKKFLRNLYLDFYRTLASHIPGIEQKTCVELGSGGGFIKEIYPRVRTSDVLRLPGVDACFSALAMPFRNGSIDAFLMIDVFHHVPDAFVFLSEMERCLKPGGDIVMIEPANTPWGRFFYQNFHHEPFDPSGAWTFPSDGPLSSANGALPWIVFQRDRAEFERKFPSLELKVFRAHTPIAYLLSGGVSMRQLIPSAGYHPVRALESVLSFAGPVCGMFYTIHLSKNK